MQNKETNTIFSSEKKNYFLVYLYYLPLLEGIAFASAWLARKLVN